MPKFKKIYPRTTVLQRTQKAPRPPIEITTIPEIFYVFSDVRIKMSFIRFFKSFWRIQEKAVYIQNLSLTWVIENTALVRAAFLFWLYRKPPDKCYYYESFVIQVKNQRKWFLKLILIIILFVISVCHVGFKLDFFSILRDEKFEVSEHPTNDMREMSPLNKPDFYSLTLSEDFPMTDQA